MPNDAHQGEAVAAATAPSERNSGASSDETSDDPSLPRKRTHGGSRNKQSYGDKLVCMEPHKIHCFLQEKRCLCGASCLRKLFDKGEAGTKVIHDLREARFARKYHQDSMPCPFFSPPG